ncbi:Hypothetical predicted protein, partial [Marmota monax]
MPSTPEWIRQAAVLRSLRFDTSLLIGHYVLIKQLCRFPRLQPRSQRHGCW